MNSITLIMAVQRVLRAEGLYAGKIDGIDGRLTTAGIREYQKRHGIDVKWPGTLGPKTIGHMLPDLGGGVVEQAAALPAIARPWYDLALRKKGLHEGRDYTALSAFLRSDGKTLGDPRQLPWCGDFVETCIAVTLPGEALPVNPYLARNWLKFGIACDLQLGCVVVFWRGTKSGTSGHVGFLAGIGPGVLYVLGGNQSNSVSVAPLGRDRLLGSRWPKTVPVPPRIVLPEMVGGKLSVNEA